MRRSQETLAILVPLICGGADRRCWHSRLDVGGPVDRNNGPDRLKAMHQPEEERDQRCLGRCDHQSLPPILVSELESSGAKGASQVQVRILTEVTKRCFEAITQAILPPGG